MTLGARVEFADEGVAVEHQHALFDSNDLHPVSRQGLADPPFLSADLQRALAVDFQNPCARWILPLPRMRIVASWTGLPARPRRLHAESFMGPHMVVLPAIGIQPGLP